MTLKELRNYCNEAESQQLGSIREQAVVTLKSLGIINPFIPDSTKFRIGEFNKVANWIKFKKKNSKTIKYCRFHSGSQRVKKQHHSKILWVST